MNLETILVIEIVGKDARTFLNGLLTNDIQNLKIGTGCYALLCSAKGKILADLFCYCIEENRFRLMVSKELHKKVWDLLQKYIVIQDVTIQEFRDQMSEEMRIESTIPKYGIDMDENTFPQEAGLYHALNFQKGCYVGQETIARLEHLGHVNRKLCLLKAQKPIQPKDPLFSPEGERVGEVTSSCYSEKYKAFIALGYVRIKYAKTGQKITVKDQEGEIVKSV